MSHFLFLPVTNQTFRVEEVAVRASVILVFSWVAWGFGEEWDPDEAKLEFIDPRTKVSRLRSCPSVLIPPNRVMIFSIPDSSIIQATTTTCPNIPERFFPLGFGSRFGLNRTTGLKGIEMISVSRE